ncbi:uncharacterized protein LOC131166357 isoform X2 [Malania oleifera]|uniref:uncharacterized protein LOC131166357 isoform X2 n=1 Tax=Malania oleifera TaxID=397392 RepID=UPI0025AE2098|nr:uncharacterized protein LOC131166357 isoform X2 [Malania oleifera]
MGRRKQIRPRHAAGMVESNGKAEGELDNQSTSQYQYASNNESNVSDAPLFVEVDRRSWVSDEHFDISEVVLTNLNTRERFFNYQADGHFYQESKYFLRFRLCNVKQMDRIRLGHWPVLPASSISLEFIEKRLSDDMETHDMILSGSFDGTDDGVSGLVHLVSLKFMTVRPILGVASSEDISSLRLRVEILRSAFDACDSLLDNTRQLWKRSMMNVMAWLRPEATTSEAIYGVTKSADLELDLHMRKKQGASISRQHARFDACGFYEAIKPSKSEQMLIDDIPDLLPELRPYQRRAAHWMVQREKGASASLGERERNQHLSPLSVAVDFIDTCVKMFYNPFSGNVSLHPEYSSMHIFGGILADEMGLGKTVELLACIFAHRKPASEEGIFFDNVLQATEDQKANFKRLKKERVECVCGSVAESSSYKGLWVQCDICDAWQHADCVGYSPTLKISKSRKISNGQTCKIKPTANLEKQMRKKNTTNIVLMDGEHICQLCSELIQATHSPVGTGATLVVCPAPILLQWHAEITRHIRPGSLTVCIYEGVRNTSLSNASGMDISELVSADVVLTTYDVLKEDLSHDSDRHDGDRRFMRFQKRYPVIPTILTRIFWWRICLDEAQMVESNAAAATEMALRLHTMHRWCITGTPIQRGLGDLYGLLKFLKATPFDVHRWWNEVMRDPYERGDAAAMEFTHKFFKQIMWRSSKIHVADELQLPPQEECLSWLFFSAIEEHFYERQHEKCVSFAREVIEHFKDEIFKRRAPGCPSSDTSSDLFITQTEAAKLLNSLLKLRQACCHPQVGSSGLRSLQQSPMTMEEILQVLVGKTKIEGEEALRRLVVALNGLAGIAIINQNFSQAVSLYEDALTFAEEHSEDFRLDPLLNLHIHHNLAEILPLTSGHSQQILSKGGQFSEICEGKPSKRYSVEECNQSLLKRQKRSCEDNSDTTTASGKLFVFTSNHAANGIVSDGECGAGQHVLSRFPTVGCLRTACESIKRKYLSVFSSKLSVAQQEFKRSYMQSALDLLEASRKTLIDQILEIDQTMENPRAEDVERVRYCPKCYQNGDGPLCVHCELDELFQVYEARLFRSSKAHGGMISSAEEAVDLQKKKSARNHFYWTLSQSNKKPSSSTVENEEYKTKRVAREDVVVSKCPSDLEVVLGVIKSYSKAQLCRDDISAAANHLLLLEAMRKEYAHARSLGTAQAQVLRAHDEIKMATSRLRLRKDENDESIDALSVEQLVVESIEFSNEKFTSLNFLLRIKGQLRYLKGLVQSKQKVQLENPNSLSFTQNTATSLTSQIEERDECLLKANEEACPICQEKLSNQKMVFQCGHVICCKCLFAMTERRLVHHGGFQDKWLMCATCRQHTKFENIAYADDRENKLCNSNVLHASQSHEKSEALVTVQGSYSTKIEAVTRRILWIKSMDPKAKILVFSSWNDVLDVLEHALTTNNISHIRMKGGRKSHIAISHFRGQKNCAGASSMHASLQAESKFFQVLLLLIHHGANGLNLLEAQHVVLVEPLLNPAAEAQAISRVHRIGQQKKTLIHRFVVKNTVEESIYKMNRSRNSNSFISGNTKNQDQPILTLKDVESLFTVVPSIFPKSNEESTESLRHLPPSVAAAVAAERRLKKCAA